MDIEDIRNFCGSEVDVQMLTSMHLHGTFESSKIVFPDPPQSAWLVSEHFFTVFKKCEDGNVEKKNLFPEPRFSILINTDADFYALLASRALIFDISFDHFFDE